MKQTSEEKCKVYSKILNKFGKELGAGKVPHTDETVTYFEQSDEFFYWYNFGGNSTTFFKFKGDEPILILKERLKKEIERKQAEWTN